MLLGSSGSLIHHSRWCGCKGALVGSRLGLTRTLAAAIGWLCVEVSTGPGAHLGSHQPGVVTY